ncbi:MAG: SurA N-terminal domain-containing protein [Burkholderiales bacterium]
MFDYIQRNKRIAQVVLALIFLPFALFGVERYFSSIGDGDYVAQVGGYKISPQEFTQALRDEQEKMRARMGNNFTPVILEDPEVRAAILENLIQQRLALSAAGRSGLTASDAQVYNVITQFQPFQENGKFSKPRYESLLRNQGLTPLGFEARLRQDIVLQQFNDAFVTSFVPHSVVERLIRLSEQQREVSQAVLSPDQYMLQIKVGEDDTQRYYEAHRSEFQVPEQARADYLVLSIDSLMAQVKVSADEIRKYYDEHATQFETRQASHILISIAPNAGADAKAQARAKAEQLYLEASKNPEKFAELAKTNSQDPGSAAKGGDLGFFGHGAMVKPFDEAVFQMKPGEIAGPVETPFGYHVIKLTAVKPVPFEQAQAQAEQDLKKQQAAKKFNEIAENFSNMVYEQADSLKPAADAFKLATQHAQLARDGDGAPALLSGAKILQALFAQDTIKNKRNTEAVEVAPSTLVAAHVTEYKAASVKPLDQVKGDINRLLLQEKASELAKKDGAEKLTKLKEGKDVALTWGAPLMVTRQRAAPGLDAAALSAVFKADAAKLPAYTGVELPQGGFALLKISRVEEAGQIDETKRKIFAGQLQQLLAQEELAAYLAGIRQKADVKINQQALEKKER